MDLGSFPQCPMYDLPRSLDPWGEACLCQYALSLTLAAHAMSQLCQKSECRSSDPQQSARPPYVPGVPCIERDFIQENVTPLLIRWQPIRRGVS
ncbi:unnamed protein product [Merluccius merluccius]